MDDTPRVLIVDDESVNVKMLQWMPTDAGFRVDTAGSGPVGRVPALEAGGDFYDVFPITDHECGCLVAGVSGHDLGASFTTSSPKALVSQNAGPLFSPQETLRNINAVLRVMFKDGRHLTAGLPLAEAVGEITRRLTSDHPGRDDDLALLGVGV